VLDRIAATHRFLLASSRQTAPEKTAMPRKLISSGSRFEAEVGYSRAVVDGDFIFMSGCTGYDYATMTISNDIVAQCEQTFRNIDTALKEAGSSLADVVRVLIIVPNRADWPACWPVFRKHFGDVRPASTMIVAGLASEEMKIEIEVTARRRQ
jgi:enamine deaminase RidA (YjgF/YER057c/UK114 family)